METFGSTEKLKVKCKWCGNEFEKDKNIALVKCPKCGKDNFYYVIR